MASMSSTRHLATGGRVFFSWQGLPSRSYGTQVFPGYTTDGSAAMFARASEFADRTAIVSDGQAYTYQVRSRVAGNTAPFHMSVSPCSSHIGPSRRLGNPCSLDAGAGGKERLGASTCRLSGEALLRLCRYTVGHLARRYAAGQSFRAAPVPSTTFPLTGGCAVPLCYSHPAPELQYTVTDSEVPQRILFAPPQSMRGHSSIPTHEGTHVHTGNHDLPRVVVYLPPL